MSVLDDSRGRRGAIGVELPLTTRQIEITNIYESGEEIVVAEKIELRDRSEFKNEEEWDDYLRDTIFPLTGTGRVEGNAGYFVNSTDDLDPKIDLDFC